MYKRVLVLVGLSLLVAACNRNPLEVVVSRCPAIAIVGDTGTLVKFQGEGRAVEDISYTASITDMTISCEQEDDIRSVVQFAISGGVGAAHDGSPANLEYFVVVLKDNSQIITKKVYDVDLRFGADGNAYVQQSVANVIPDIEQARRYNYEILVGFQLSPQEVVYNIER